MSPPPDSPRTPVSADSTRAIGDLSDVVGYLNFSNGRPDSRFQDRLNRMFAITPQKTRRAVEVRAILLDAIQDLHGHSSTFKNVGQAEAVVRLVFDRCLPAYARRHADLMFHLPQDELEQPLFIARMFEAVLEQGPPWEDVNRIVEGTLDRLNDFVGHRPVAVLENNRKMEPYPHERFRPVPLYLQGVGAAAGRYHDLIDHTIRFFAETPASILQQSYFELAQLEELAMDVRAHDHLHPANKRTNYMFGEWDPSLIDVKGRYRRFVVRQIILDGLLRWMDSQKGVPREEVLFDASAVLCGTMLMASSISGGGPAEFDSNTTLSSLLPKVARQRDAFYERLLKNATGARGRRLNQQAKLSRQPFGHVRQQLNIDLAQFGARQVQYRHLAQLYARIGNAEAAQQQAAVIPSASVRFETEIRWRIAAVHQRLDRGQLNLAAPFAEELESLLKRGIECGALVDPWNILGFQGQFPLFQSREDSLPDQRVEILLELVEEIFGIFGRLLNEAAAQGAQTIHEELTARFLRLTESWDRYATTTVDDLPKVSGRESFESAQHVSRALGEWRSAGESAGAISFWRQHVAEFQSAKSYALVVDALLQRHDAVASMGLLMQWLSQAEDVGLESGPHSFYALLLRWMDVVVSAGQAVSDRSAVSAQFRRLFDHLEANAGIFWSAPTLEEGLGLARPPAGDPAGRPSESEIAEERLLDEEADEDDEDNLFEAAWDDVVWRDSAEDGHAGDTLDDHVASPQNTEFELLARQLEPRLRFLNTVADLWQRAAIVIAGAGLKNFPSAPTSRGASLEDAVRNWKARAEEVQFQLSGLLLSIRNYELTRPSGDFESNIEFDSQHQTKLFLLHTVINTTVSFRLAARYLACCLDERRPTAANRKEARLESLMLDVSQAIFRRDAASVRRRLPELVRALATRPLLYVSLENGGDPTQVLEARTLQTSLRFLLSQLPSLGLLAETWHMLYTAFRMERKSPPRGQAVTEFDRLFRLGLQSVLESLCQSSTSWRPPGSTLAILRKGRRNRIGSRTRLAKERVSIGPSAAPPSGRSRLPRSVRRLSKGQRTSTARSSRRTMLSPKWFRKLQKSVRDISSPINWRDRGLVVFGADLVNAFSGLWIRHSRTMRLSTVEAMVANDVFQQVRKFIQTFGQDLFHSRMLMLGNIRAILHNCVEAFLEHLDENEDPLHPLRILDSLRQGDLQPEDAEHWMELIYGTIVDKFDRFLEYNTTTTQSDYGEMLYCLIDFLRVEAGYDRDAWELAPECVAHELLSQEGKTAAARAWEERFRKSTQGKADRHVEALRRVEGLHGMRLPSMADHIQERFVKPLAVNRMSALIPRVVQDARAGVHRSLAFDALREEINSYLETMSGSGIDVPVWLRNLERDVDRVLDASGALRETHELEVRLAPRRLSLQQMRRQVKLCQQFVEKLLDKRRV